MRLIDADALIKEIAKIEDLRTLSTKTIGEAIDRVTGVETKQKTGKWIETGKWSAIPKSEEGFVLKCSECGEIDPRMYWSDLYCPNCGARMVGEEE